MTIIVIKLSSSLHLQSLSETLRRLINFQTIALDSHIPMQHGDTWASGSRRNTIHNVTRSMAQLTRPGRPPDGRPVRNIRCLRLSQCFPNTSQVDVILWPSIKLVTNFITCSSLLCDVQTLPDYNSFCNKPTKMST